MIQEVVHYIETNLYKDISPGELCQNHDISEFHFHQFFKGIINCSFIDYINKRRISDQLYRWVSCNRTWSVALISNMAKLKNVQALSKILKVSFDTTPNKYYKTFDGSELYPPFNFMKYTPKEQDVFEKKPVFFTLDEKVLIGESVKTRSYKSQYIKDISILKDKIDFHYKKLRHLSDFNHHEMSFIYNSTIDSETKDNIVFEVFDGYCVVDTSKKPKMFKIMTLPKQEYICFKSNNTNHEILRTLDFIYSDYLINHAIRLKNTPIDIIERYSSEKGVNGLNLIEICIPIEKK